MIELGVAHYGLLLSVYAVAVIASEAKAIWISTAQKDLPSQHRDPVAVVAIAADGTS